MTERRRYIQVMIFFVAVQTCIAIISHYDGERRLKEFGKHVEVVVTALHDNDYSCHILDDEKLIACTLIGPQK